MRQPPHRARTLEEIEGQSPPATTPETHLVATCRRLRRKPIDEFSVEDLRIMIGQGIGTRHLVPLALDLLQADPLAEGDLYPGDLLASVLAVEPSFWAREWEWRDRLRRIMDALEEIPDELRDAVLAFRGATEPPGTKAARRTTT